MSSGWSRPFDVPINLPSGKRIVTLDDARKYLLAIPRAKQNEAVATAVEAVLMAAEGRGPMLHANVGVGLVVYGPRKLVKRKKQAKKFTLITNKKAAPLPKE